MTDINDLAGAELVQRLLGPEYANQLEAIKTQILQSKAATKEAAAEFTVLGKAVFDNPHGRKFLAELAANTLSRPVYPPPTGQKAGQYAAQRAGQINMVVLLASFLE